jgi:hypothetical protein
VLNSRLDLTLVLQMGTLRAGFFTLLGIIPEIRFSVETLF